MLKIKCSNCKKEISKVFINHFNYDGSDSEISVEFTEIFNYENKGIVIRTDSNWTGYDLTDEERKDTILCPYCKQYPFDRRINIPKKILDELDIKEDDIMILYVEDNKIILEKKE